jgi:hypothetical protein
MTLTGYTLIVCICKARRRSDAPRQGYTRRPAAAAQAVSAARSRANIVASGSSGSASSDLCDVLVERHRRAATVITSNRAVEEWVALFDDPILANSALDRFAHRAPQIVMEGPSLRAPRTLRSPKGRRPGEKPDSGG